MDLSRVGEEHDGCTKRHDPANPRCKRWTKLHMVDTRYVATRILVHRAHVDHRFSASMARLQVLRAEWCELGPMAQHARPSFVQRAHVVKIRWITGHAGPEPVNEKLRIRQLQEWIAAALATSGGH